MGSPSLGGPALVKLGAESVGQADAGFLGNGVEDSITCLLSWLLPVSSGLGMKPG
ncbi:hypothetical protein CGRA01v4_04616 [Colletotrichum graminicola]|nr:hypothetical protein CGRA01v4_04616 [Colletotrichum graminicola]